MRRLAFPLVLRLNEVCRREKNLTEEDIHVNILDIRYISIAF